jgi:hypothetical protein
MSVLHGYEIKNIKTIFINFLLTLNRNIMKKVLLSFALIAFIILGTISVAKATTVTFYVQITLSDTCSPSPYHGYYCVKLNLTFNGSPICSAINCNVTGTGCYPFTCNLDDLASDPYYGVALVDAFRYPSGSCSTTNGTGSSNLSWNDMINSSCVAKLTIIL